MREYEAWSCDDVDSVHNDYQRHLLYIWAFPEFETQKMEAWGSWAQDPKDGHVFECLAGFGHGPLDKPTGRYMASAAATAVLLHCFASVLPCCLWPYRGNHRSHTASAQARKSSRPPLSVADLRDMTHVAWVFYVALSVVTCPTLSNLR